MLLVGHRVIILVRNFGMIARLYANVLPFRQLLTCHNSIYYILTRTIVVVPSKRDIDYITLFK